MAAQTSLFTKLLISTARRHPKALTRNRSHRKALLKYITRVLQGGR